MRKIKFSKKDKVFKEIQNDSAITLASLIITIIVILILAGTSISLIAGNTGILDQTAGAITDANNEVILDDTRIAIAKFAIQWDGSTTLGDYVKNKLESYSEGYPTEEEAKIKVIDKVNGIITYTETNGKETRLKIDDDGNVSFYNEN